MLRTQKELKPAFAAEVAKAWEDEKNGLSKIDTWSFLSD